MVGVLRNDGIFISAVREERCRAGRPDEEPHRSSQASSEYLSYFEAKVAMKAVTTLNHTRTQVHQHPVKE